MGIRKSPAQAYVGIDVMYDSRRVVGGEVGKLVLHGYQRKIKV